MLPYSREVLFVLVAESNRGFPFLQGIGTVVLIGLAAALVSRRMSAVRLVIGAIGLLWLCCGIIWFRDALGPLFFLAPALAVLALVQAAALFALACGPFVEGVARLAPALAAVGLALLWPLGDLGAGPGFPALRGPGLHPEPLLLATAGVVLGTVARGGRWWLFPALPLAGFGGYAAWALRLPFDFAVPLVVVASFAVARGASGKNRLKPGKSRPVSSREEPRPR